MKPTASPNTKTNIALPILSALTHTHLDTHLNSYTLTQHIHTLFLCGHTQSPSLLSFRRLCAALHDAITSLLTDTEDSVCTYFLDDPSVFNSLVVSCTKTVPLSLSLFLPAPKAASRGTKTTPPSAIKGWNKVKTTVKMYLGDLLRLLEGLKDASMLCALLKHIQAMVEYYICYPKLAKRLRKVLVKCWSEGDSHVQVMAFMVLRRITLLQPHPALHHLLKVYIMYM